MLVASQRLTEGLTLSLGAAELCCGAQQPPWRLSKRVSRALATGLSSALGTATGRALEMRLASWPFGAVAAGPSHASREGDPKSG